MVGEMMDWPIPVGIIASGLAYSPSFLYHLALKISVKVAKHSRYVILQMAEAVLPRAIFREILECIRQLRSGPEPVRVGWLSKQLKFGFL
jgi:hypothetical protein